MLTQFFLLLLVTWGGELLNKVAAVPVPGAILGMGGLLLLLSLRVIKLPRVEAGADRLLGLLPLFFIPLFVRLLDILPLLKNYGGRLLLLLATTTVVVMGATALAARFFLFIAAKGRTP